MKRNTWIVLGTFVVLLVAVLVLERTPQGDRPKSLSLPVLQEATPAKAAADADKEAPKAVATAADSVDAINRIEITRKGQQVVLERAGKDDWQLSKPRTARADSYKVQAMLRVFTSQTESVFSTPLEDEGDRRYYGLDDADRIGVKLYRDGVVWLDLVLGAAQKSDDEGYEKDTFVQSGGDGLIYRVQGKDLRSPFDKDVDDLRSKKLFGFKREDVRELRVATTTDPATPELVLRREEPGEVAEGQAKPEERWTMVTPAGYRAGTPTSYLSTLANLHVSAFADQAPPEAHLDAAPWRVTVITSDGAKTTLLLGEEVDNEVWAQVEGSDEAVKLSKYTAQSLKKGAMDFRDKTLLALPVDEVVGRGYGPLTLRRAGDTWQISGPQAAEAGADEVQRALRDATSFAVDSFLPTPPPPAESGLGPDAARFVLRTAERTLELRLGAEKEGKVYGQLAGSDEVFLATSYNAGKLKKGFEDLRRHGIFTGQAADLTRITLTHPDEALVLEKKAAEGAPAGTPAAWTLTSPADAGDLQQPKLDSVASTLAALKAKDIVPLAEAPKGAWDDAFVLTWSDAQGATRKLWISNEKKEGNAWARTDDPAWAGQAVTLQPFQVNAIKKRLKELKK